MENPIEKIGKNTIKIKDFEKVLELLDKHNMLSHIDGLLQTLINQLKAESELINIGRLQGRIQELEFLKKILQKVEKVVDKGKQSILEE